MTDNRILDGGLKACPWCGCVPKRNGRGRVGGVVCNVGAKHRVQIYGSDQAEADAFWNKFAERTPQPAPDGVEPRGCPTPGACSCPSSVRTAAVPISVKPESANELERRATKTRYVPIADVDRHEFALGLKLQGYDASRALRMAWQEIQDNDGALQMLARHRLSARPAPPVEEDGEALARICDGLQLILDTEVGSGKWHPESLHARTVQAGIAALSVYRGEGE